MSIDTLTITDLKLDPSLTQAWLECIGEHLPSCLTAQQTQQLSSSLSLSMITLAHELLPLAAKFAVTPISGFNVGAILIDAKDQFFFGANHEQTRRPLAHTLHAEQAAFFNALCHDCARLKHLVVNAAPCGHCRQFIREYPFCFDLMLHFGGQTYTFEQILPHSFGPDDLHIQQHLCSNAPQLSDIKQLATYSYSPYSDSQVGLIAKQAKKVLAYSWYIENAAFNPSASPFSLLLSQIHLNSYTVEQVDTIDCYVSPDSLDFVKELKTISDQYSRIQWNFID